MVTDELIVFIKNQLKTGLSENQIRPILIKQGWKTEEIDLAFAKTSSINEKLASPLELLKRSIKILTTKWKSIILLFTYTFIKLLFYIILVTLTAVLFAFIISRLNAPQIFTYIWVAIFASGLLAIIVNISVRSHVSLLIYIDSHIDKISAKNLYNKSKGKVLGFLEVAFLASIYLLLGFFLFIIPGIYYLVIFAFVTYFYIFDGIKGPNALNASRELVKNRFWAVVGRLLFMYILSSVLSNALNNLPVSGLKLSGFPLTYDELYTNSDFTQIDLVRGPILITVLAVISIFIQTVFITPLAAIYNLVLFRELKQNYAGSFPTQSVKNSKNLKYLITPTIGIILLLSVFGLITLTAFLPNISGFLNNRQNNNISYPENSITPFISSTPTEITNKTYSDETCGYSVSYTNKFDNYKTEEYNVVYFQFNDNPHDNVEIYCGDDIPGQGQPPNTSEDIYVGGINGTYNHYIFDREPIEINEVTLTHPINSKKIRIIGFGQFFDQIIYSFKFTGWREM